MMDNGVTLKEYKDLLDKVGWLIDEDGYGGYNAYNQEHTIHLYFRLNDSSTIYLTIEPLLPYISWPKEEIAMGIEKLGAKEVTFPDLSSAYIAEITITSKEDYFLLDLFMCSQTFENKALEEAFLLGNWQYSSTYGGYR